MKRNSNLCHASSPRSPSAMTDARRSAQRILLEYDVSYVTIVQHDHPRSLKYHTFILPMPGYPKALIPAGSILGIIAWVTIPIFLPLLMWAEAPSGRANYALVFVLTGPALIFPWTFLGVWYPRISSRLFLISSIVNLVALILWFQAHSNFKIEGIEDLFGLFVFYLAPGPLLLLVFAILFNRVKLPDSGR